MKLKQLLNSDRGVSPVIGVILMVAITVILAAVIGTFVLGLGENVSSSAPQASLSFDVQDDANETTIEHTGGDAIPAEEVDVQVTNETSDTSVTFEAVDESPEELTVGDEAVIYGNPGGEANVTWPKDGGAELTPETAGTNFTFDSGNTYTIQIIHTESDRMIADQEVRP